MENKNNNNAGFLITVGGLSGSGKSTLSRRIRDELQKKGHDAVWVCSDIVRKRLYLYPDYTWKLPDECYSEDFSRKTYQEMNRQIEEALSQGKVVVADMVFSKPSERKAIEKLAKDCDVPFTGLWLDAPETDMKERVKLRMNDSSDADSKVIDLQMTFNLGQIDWNKLDASGTPENSWRQAKQSLNHGGFDLQKMVEWRDVYIKSREGAYKTGGESPEHKYFYTPLIQTMWRDLLDRKLTGYSEFGEEPSILTDERFRVFLSLGKGPDDVLFDADEFSAYIEKFTMVEGQTGQYAFDNAKRAFINAIRKAEDLSGNKVLKPIEFSCNSDDFEQEIRGSKRDNVPRPKKLH